VGDNLCFMGVIGIADVWKMFEWAHKEWRGPKTQRKAAAIEWLEEVRKELRDLSEIWIEICNKIEDGRLKTLPDIRAHPGVSLYLDLEVEPGVALIQQRINYQLRNFYQSASRVLVGQDKFQRDFLYALKTLLIERDKARRVIDQGRGVILIDSSSAADGLGTLRSASEAIQKEVAALQVLIANFKANG
jgi:hypothetical protein